MYQLQDSVLLVKGIGANLQKNLAKEQIEQILDLLLFLPLRYEDRSSIKSIIEIKNLTTSETTLANSTENQKVKTNFVTTFAKLLKFNEYRKGRLLISRATIYDGTGQINCVWFNNKFLKNRMIVGQSFFFSGNLKDDTLMQATVEKVAEDAEGIHTGRLVPIYSQLADFKQGNLRRILAEIIGKLHQAGNFEQIFHDLHFPESIDKIIAARENLALEEIICLIQKSQQAKKEHQKKHAIFSLPTSIKQKHIDSSSSLPFTLTAAQNKAVEEIFNDLQETTPMNRLLVGDVGSGKTIVAAIPASTMVENGQNVCLIVPTKILAQQHFTNLSKIFKNISFCLINSDVKQELSSSTTSEGVFYIGTHSILNRLKKINPSLVIYDEQQRFGVKHRQLDEYLDKNQNQPHLLSMTATPIPRSLMLSIFSHLDLSYLDQMPNSRKMATTWFIPKSKEKKAIEWLAKELLGGNTTGERKQALIICPFINPSSYGATENVAAVKDSLELLKKELKTIYKKLNIKQDSQLEIDVLHSQLNKKQQAKVIENVYKQKIQILVSTPMVEVGVDLPNADIIVIQSAERFGLSSLHQLRGRVGRKGQESYCLLFSSANSDSQDRLQKFCQEKDGLKLAEIDLKNRGAGDILGYQQSGLNNLHFASWTNLEIINLAQKKLMTEPDYHSPLQDYLEKVNSQSTIQTATN